MNHRNRTAPAKRRILILSEGFGAGHTQAAYALSAELRQGCPGVQTRVMELGAFLHPTLAPVIFTAFQKTLTASPQLYGKLYRSRRDKELHRVAQLMLHRIFYAQTASVIRQLKPDMIVCTHPFPNVVVSRLKRAGLSIPLCTVITDYDAHGTWVSEQADQYLVSSEPVRKKLLSQGVPADKIAVTGIPVHPSFRQSGDRTSIRSEFELDDLPTVLVMGGGWGLMSGWAESGLVERWRERIQFVFCLGSNDKLRQMLAADARFQHPHIRLLGFTRGIGKLMEVSDLLITKPGGMTCTEGLAKAIPMLFESPIPGQEEHNLRYLISQGWGELIESEATVERRLRMLAEQYDDVLKERIAQQTKRLSAAQPNHCAGVIMRLLT